VEKSHYTKRFRFFIMRGMNSGADNDTLFRPMAVPDLKISRPASAMLFDRQVEMQRNRYMQQLVQKMNDYAPRKRKPATHSDGLDVLLELEDQGESSDQ
jgi:hypothetical protein